MRMSHIFPGTDTYWNLSIVHLKFQRDLVGRVDHHQDGKRQGTGPLCKGAKVVIYLGSLVQLCCGEG